MTEYSFYILKGIRYRNAKAQQSMCNNWQVVFKDANCVVCKEPLW